MLIHTRRRCEISEVMTEREIGSMISITDDCNVEVHVHNPTCHVIEARHPGICSAPFVIARSD